MNPLYKRINQYANLNGERTSLKWLAIGNQIIFNRRRPDGMIRWLAFLPGGKSMQENRITSRLDPFEGVSVLRI
jgi:hypothetical protein